MRFCYLVSMFVVAGVIELSFAAPAPKPKGVGPVEIDFAPLPGLEGNVDFSITLAVETENGSGLAKTEYEIGAHTTQNTIRLLIKASLPEGWDVETEGLTKLILKSYKKSLVAKVDIRIEGLGKNGPKPTVKWLGKKK